ncbi:MAG: ATP:cob(I)alamin adenosyltransferase [Roseibacillus sp.]|nr:ATP:cob(I)alamin adenosyltransferase [Roseibacillus sp.]
MTSQNRSHFELMSITTRRGDDGSTDLLFGKRISKDAPRMEAIGSVDELNAALGLVRAEADGETEEVIDGLQALLVGLMGELAVVPEDAERYAQSDYPSIGDEEVERVEQLGREIESAGVKFEGWARPGANGNRAGACLDMARTVCRRVERRVLELGEEVSNTAIPLFLNRLSDLLWLLARRTEGDS